MYKTPTLRSTVYAPKGRLLQFLTIMPYYNTRQLHSAWSQADPLVWIWQRLGQVYVHVFELNILHSSAESWLLEELKLRCILMQLYLFCYIWLYECKKMFVSKSMEFRRIKLWNLTEFSAQLKNKFAISNHDLYVLHFYMGFHFYAWKPTLNWWLFHPKEIIFDEELLA